MNQDSDWIDQYNGIPNPQQYSIGPDGSMQTQQQQGNMGGTLAGLQQLISGLNMGGNIGMPSVDAYGNQSLDVAPNSDFIGSASTDLSY